MKKIVTVAIAASFAVLSCGPSVQHPHVHQPTDTPKCADACIHLRELKCVEGTPLPDGTTCESFCESTQNSGHALTPSCVMRINKCSDMEQLDAFCPAGVQRP